MLDALEMVTERAEATDTTAQPLHLRDIEAASEHNRGEREAERETKRETASAANVTSSESTTKKARKNRNHKPPKGQYAEHFDHVGKEADQSQGITVRQAHERLNMIERRKPLYSPAFAGFASACACASFVFLLGGGPFDMIGAFIGAGLGHWAAPPPVRPPSQPVLCDVRMRGRRGTRLHGHPAIDWYFRARRIAA